MKKIKTIHDQSDRHKFNINNQVNLLGIYTFDNHIEKSDRHCSIFFKGICELSENITGSLGVYISDYIKNKKIFDGLIGDTVEFKREFKIVQFFNKKKDETYGYLLEPKNKLYVIGLIQDWEYEYKNLKLID